MRYLPLILLLTGCVIQPLPQVVPEQPKPPVVINSTPAVLHDSCVEDWYIKPSLPLPECVETYMKACNAPKKHKGAR